MLVVALETSATLPPFGAGRVLSEWTLAPLPFVVSVWAVGLYLLGLRALHRRGDRWPLGRGLAFGAWIAAFSPALAGPLVDLLRAAAGQPAPEPAAVALARVLLDRLP